MHLIPIPIPWLILFPFPWDPWDPSLPHSHAHLYYTVGLPQTLRPGARVRYTTRPAGHQGRHTQRLVTVSAYHDAGADGDGSTAVRVGHDVAVADRQERDRDQPHRVEQVLVLDIVITAGPAHKQTPVSNGKRKRSIKRKKGSPYSFAERRVPELIPVLGSQPAGDVSHVPGGRLPLLSARPAFTLATLKRAATNFAA